MKILVITNNLNKKNGWGNYSLAIIEQLIKNRIEVVVICSKKNKEYSNVKQIEILPDPISFKKTYFLSFFYVLRILLNYKDLKNVDLIHCFVEPYSFITYLVSKILVVKYFITIHGSYGVKTLQNFFYRFLQIITYKNAQKIICVSNYTKKRLLDYKKLDNLIVINNGVYVNSSKKQILSIHKKENIIIGVGALKKRKGFDVVIDSIKIVVETIPDVKYYIIGSQIDNNYVIHIKKMIKDLGLNNNIFLSGRVSDNKLEEFYQKSKIFVLTPVNDGFNFEGFGLVYLEANVYTLPTVGSYDNGGEDAIKDGYNGFLVKANDSKDTAEKIIRLLSDSELYNEMSQNAIKWSHKMMWGNIFEKYMHVYIT